MSTASRFKGTALQWLTVDDTCYQADSHHCTITELRQDSAETDGHCQHCEMSVLWQLWVGHLCQQCGQPDVAAGGSCHCRGSQLVPRQQSSNAGHRLKGPQGLLLQVRLCLRLRLQSAALMQLSAVCNCSS